MLAYRNEDKQMYLRSNGTWTALAQRDKVQFEHDISTFYHSQFLQHHVYTPSASIRSLCTNEYILPMPF